MQKREKEPVTRKYLSYQGAERFTGLSRWTLMRARERGELPATRVGTAVRFSVDRLEAFMEERAR